MKITITIYFISFLALLYSFSNRSDVAEITFLCAFFIAFIKMGVDAWKAFLSQPREYLSKYEIDYLYNIDQDMKLKLIDINRKIEYLKDIQSFPKNHIFISNPIIYPGAHFEPNYDAPVF